MLVGSKSSMDEYNQHASTVWPSPLHHPDVLQGVIWTFLEPEAVTASQCLMVEKINYFNSMELGKWEIGRRENLLFSFSLFMTQYCFVQVYGSMFYLASQVIASVKFQKA